MVGGIANQLDLGRRLEAGTSWTRDHLFVGRRRIWVTAAIITVLTWPVTFGVPTPSIDLSWMSGLYMGIDHGKEFGSEVIFTYGPLGFLDWPILFYSWLALLSLVFSAVVYFTFTMTMTALLERSVGLLGAAMIIFLFLVTIPDMEQLPLVLATAWALTALRGDRPENAVKVLAIAGGALSAVEVLIKLSVGPVIFLVVLLAMVGARADRRRWAWFLGTSVGGTIVLWLIAGQSLGNLWDYAANGFQIASGYNEAMLLLGGPHWLEVVLPLFAVGLVAATACAAFRDRRARIAAVLLVAVAAFSSYKYGIVRFEPAHASLGLSALLGIWLALPWRRTFASAFVVVTLIAGGILVHASPSAPRLDAWRNVQAFGETAEIALRPGLRQGLVDQSRAGLQAAYALDPRTLALLKGKRVDIDPWEVEVAWAYGLDWSPLPVIQNYSAYTQKLDRLNSETVEDAANGPQVILRQNPNGSRSFEGRLPAWDPPEQNFKILCNFAPAHETETWQVLTRVPDRCGEAEPIGEAEANPGEAIQIPQAHSGQVVLMKIEGAKVEGLEKIRSLLWRPRERFASVNDGSAVYRLVPGTTEDGLIVSRDPRLDSKGVFEQLPEVENLKIEGISGLFRFKFYAVQVQVTPKA